MKFRMSETMEMARSDDAWDLQIHSHVPFEPLSFISVLFQRVRSSCTVVGTTSFLAFGTKVFSFQI